MPTRARRHRTRPFFGDWDETTLYFALALGPRPVECGGPPDDVLAKVWTLFQTKLMAHGRDWGYWAFTPGIPDDLRGGRHGFIPEDESDEYEAQQADLAARRRAFLAERRR